MAQLENKLMGSTFQGEIINGACCIWAWFWGSSIIYIENFTADYSKESKQPSYVSQRFVSNMTVMFLPVFHSGL